MRVAVLAVAALLGAAPSASAQGQGVVDITAGWSRAVGAPDSDWSAPEVRDDSWPVSSLSTSWADQGLDGVSGVVWYRKTVTLPEPLSSGTPSLGVVIGAVSYGAWALYADGIQVGTWGWGREPVPLPRPRLVTLPRTVGRDGKVVLALEVRRRAWVADGADAHAPAIGGAYIGSSDLLSSRLEVMGLRDETAHTATLLFAVLALLTGLSHLYLFGSRMGERAYLWFGLACLAFAVNAIAFSPWTSAWFRTFGTPYRLTSASGHVAAALLLVFLWDVFGRRPGRFMGTYIGSHVALGALVLGLPFQWVYVSEGARFAWLVPGLLAALTLIVLEIYRGNPDARTLAVGGSILVAGELAELLRLAGAQLPSSLPYVGFSAALLSVAAMLAGHFSRAHEELEGLRRDLEARVMERTAALAAATREAQVANEAKSRFLGLMSHELRTPLNAVIGFANVLAKRAVRARGMLESRDMDFLERIRANGVQLLSLVDDLLDLTRIESGAVRIEYQQVEVGALVRDLLAELSATAVDRKVRLEAVVPAYVAPVYTDPVRLKQIFTNLVDNAVKFAPGGSVTVTVHARAGRVARIEVADTGVGIPAEDMTRMLGLFAQGDESTRRRHGGAGLGLSITKGLCGLLGYGLRMESAVGQGTTVTVDLERPPTGGRPGDTIADVSASDEPDGLRRISILDWKPKAGLPVQGS